jgi:hypothetical protein
MKNTMIHATMRQTTIHHLNPPLLSMSAAASSVSRYQKYSVSEERAHSSTMVPLAVSGHVAHGRGNCEEEEKNSLAELAGGTSPARLTRKLFTK